MRYIPPACGRHEEHAAHHFNPTEDTRALCQGWTPHQNHGSHPFWRDAFNEPPVTAATPRAGHRPPGPQFTMTRDRACHEVFDQIAHRPHEWGQHASIGEDFIWAMFECPGHLTWTQVRMRELIYGQPLASSYSGLITIITNG